VGFVLAGVRGWAYGVERHGWVEVIGVAPEWQGRGVSKELLDALIAYFRRAGVASVQTVVNWNQGDLVDFFRSNGFERGEFVNLVKEL
jgi:ribosomal protein S18 acetylase RimI-like enzyme